MLRFAVVGCGAAARRIHLPQVRAAACEVTAFASRTRASADAAQAEWGSGSVHDDWRAAVVADDVDAVCVCGPNALHAEVAIAAAEAGKHVLVEKPIAATLDQADSMIEAAERNSVVLMPAHNLRLAPPFLAIAQAVERGDLGEVRAVRGAFGHGGPEGWAPESTWFRDASVSGGGALIDLGIHLIDLVHAATGQRIVEVVAVLDADGGDVEHAGSIAGRLAGGALVTLQSSWIAPGRDLQLTVVGSEATAHVDAWSRATLHPPAGDPQPLRAADPRPDLYGAFAAAVQGEPPSGVATAADARAALAVVAAAYESARSETLVRLEHTT